VDVPQSLGEAVIQVSADTSRLQSQVSDGTKKAFQSAAGDLPNAATKVGTESGNRFSKSFGSSVRNLAVGLGAVFATKKVGQFFSEAVQGASDLNEAGTALTQVFGEQGVKAIEDFASKGANALGQSELEVKRAAQTFGVYGQAAGLAGEANAKFSTDLVSLGTDLSSFYNTSPAEAIQAIGSGLRGEAEPLRRFGILLDENALKAEALATGILKPTKNLAAIKTATLKAQIAQEEYNQAVAEHGPKSLQAAKALIGVESAQAAVAKASEGSTGVLTQQQKVLAANSVILKQSKVAQGDFARTSDGLANTQRRVSAAFTDIKNKAGTALLPAVTNVANVIADKFLPPIAAFVTKYAPVVADWLDKITHRFFGLGGSMVSSPFDMLKASFAGIDWKPITEGLSKLMDGFKQLGGGAGQAGSDTVDLLGSAISGLGSALGFLADHMDTVVKAAPFVLAAFAAFKTAQAVGKLAEQLRLPTLIAQVVATRSLAASNRALAVTMREVAVSSQTATVAQTENTVAESTGILAKIRSAAATVAKKVAELAAAAASKAMAAAQWLLNAAMSANPIGLVVLALTALVGGLILAYNKVGWFRDLVNGAWGMIKDATNAMWTVIKSVFGFFVGLISSVINFVKSNWPLILGALGGPVGLAVALILKHRDKIVTFFKELPGKILDALKDLGGKMLQVGKDIVNGIIDGIKSLASKPVDLIKSVASDMWKGVKGFFHIGSPSRLMADVGVDVMAGLSQGVQEGTPSAVAVAVNAANQVVDAVQATVYTGMVAAQNAYVDNLEWIANQANVLNTELAPHAGMTDTYAAIAKRNADAARKAAAKPPPNPFGNGFVDTGGGGGGGTTSTTAPTVAQAAGEKIATWYVRGFTQGLLSSQRDAIDMLNEITKQMAKAGEKGAVKVIKKSRDAIIAKVGRLDAVRRQLEQAQANLTDRLADYNNAFAQVSNSIKDSGIFGQSGDVKPTFESIKKGLAASAKQAEDFGKALATLAAKGLNKDLYQQLVAAGPAALAQATALVEGGSAGIQQVNALQVRLAKAGETAGATTANYLYAAGVKGAQGFVDTLNKEQSGLVKKITELGEALVAGINKAIDKTPKRGLRSEAARNKAMGKPPTRADAASGAAAARTGGTVHSLNVGRINVEVKDLRRLAEVADFVEALERQQNRARTTRRSGRVTG
jgi:hypothetical protein